MESIGDAVSVVALFEPPHVFRPVRFRWNGRTCLVREVTYRWTSREGRTVLHHFSVTDGGTLYQLTFNAETLQWSLDAVEA